MRSNDGSRTGGEILVDQLVAHGVNHAFCVPGESYLAALDAFHDRNIALTVCRQEGGAAMMAEAVGKATGRPGICFVTRGPGATNASPGIHIAMQDSTPMIVFVGQVAREMREREAFQELDYRAVFGTMAKWATEIDDPARIPEIVSRAFYTATNGRPGPVVIALPEDMLTERAVVRRRAGLRAGRDLARPHRHVATAEDALGREAADHDPRRQPLVGQSLGRDAALCRALRSAGRHDLPPRASVRPDASQLCRRSRRRPQSETGGAHQGVRSRRAGRLRGWAKCRARATRCSIFRSRGRRLCMCIRAPKNSAASIARILRSTPRPPRSPRRSEGLQAPNDDPLARGDARGAMPIIVAFSDKATDVPGAVNLGEIMVWLRGQLLARRHSLQRRRQFLRLAASLLSPAPLQHALSARHRARWAMACRPRSR